MLSKLLRSNGHRCEEADDGLKAVEMVRSKLPAEAGNSSLSRSRSRVTSVNDLVGLLSTVRIPNPRSSIRVNLAASAGISASAAGSAAGSGAGTPHRSDSRRNLDRSKGRTPGPDLDPRSRQGSEASSGRMGTGADIEARGSGRVHGHGHGHGHSPGVGLGHGHGHSPGVGLGLGHGQPSRPGSVSALSAMYYDAILMDFVMVRMRVYVCMFVWMYIVCVYVCACTTMPSSWLS
jgi:hypothetical protein